MVKTGSAVLSLGVLGFVVLSTTMSLGWHRRAAKSKATWEVTFEGTTAPERFPSRERNEVADQLFSIGLRSGLALLNPAEPHAVSVSLKRQAQATRRSRLGEARVAFLEDGDTEDPDVLEQRRMAQALRDDLTLLRQADVVVPTTLSEESKALLLRFRPVLTEITGLLHSGPRPAWNQDVADVRSDCSSAELWLVSLQRLLVLEALELSAQGDQSGAWRALEASWTLGESFLHSPDPLYQELGRGLLRIVLVGAPRLCGAPESWQQRLEDLDLRSPLYLSLSTTAWQAQNLEAWSREGIGGDDLMSRYYFETAMRDYSYRLQGALDHVRGLDASSLEALAGQGVEMIGLPFWNYPGKLNAPSVSGQFALALRAELASELVARVLEAHQAGREGRLEGLLSEENGTASRVGGLFWNYQRSGDSVVVSLSDELEGQPWGWNPLPLRLEFDPSVCPGEAKAITPGTETAILHST